MRAHQRAPLPLGQLAPNHHIDHAEFILKGHERHPAGGLWPLPPHHQPSHGDCIAMLNTRQLLRAATAQHPKARAQQRQRVRPQRGAQGGVVGHQVFADSRHRQCHRGFGRYLQLGEQGQLRLHRRDLPACLVAIMCQGAQRTGIGQPGAGSAVEAGTQAQVLDIAPRPDRPRRFEPPSIGFGETADLPQPQADGQGTLGDWLQCAIPLAVAYIHRPYLDPLAACLLQQLVGAVEAHRPAIDQRTGEYRRLMAFEPTAGIAQQGETGRVRFREAITAKTLDLLEYALGKRKVVAVAQHALHQPFAVWLQAAMALPGGHAAA
ncbi:hypothetical protein D3C73_1034570 [compost metagenome]